MRARLKHLHIEHPPIAQHPGKFSGHKYCEIGDVNISNCHMNSRSSCDQGIMWL